MGHPRKARKKYDTPSHPWNADRIKRKNKLVQKYGLKNKKEVWKAETMVKRYRRDARELLGMSSEHNSQERDQLLSHLIKLGILPENAKLEAVLDLTVEDVLRRRLQTVVHRKGLAYTAQRSTSIRGSRAHSHEQQKNRLPQLPGLKGEKKNS
jgi:ribosomal protein S4(archaeal type)/S9(eukaryote cytosolic type)